MVLVCYVLDHFSHFAGWEHVFLGEWKSGTVDGQHDWARYYLLQKADKIDYHGYYSTVDVGLLINIHPCVSSTCVDPFKSDALCFQSLTGTWQYTWENELKQKGGFLIGTSPGLSNLVVSIVSS